MPLSHNCWRWHICHCCRLFDARQTPSPGHQVIPGIAWKSPKYAFYSLHMLLNYWCDITPIRSLYAIWLMMLYKYWIRRNKEQPTKHFDCHTCVCCMNHDSWFGWLQSIFPFHEKNKCALSPVDILATENKQHFCRQIYFDYIAKEIHAHASTAPTVHWVFLAKNALCFNNQATEPDTIAAWALSF